MSGSRTFLGSAAAACLLVGGLLAGCGGASNKSESHDRTVSLGSGDTVDIYSSLPGQGPVSTQTVPLVNGIKLALAQAGYKAGRWKISYHPLDDSRTPTGDWSPYLTAENARHAAADTDAVYYIGDFASGASDVSIPILAVAGIAQMSPSSGNAGQGNGATGVAADGTSPPAARSFLRIVPGDSVEGAADLLAMREARCARVALANDHSEDGLWLTDTIEQAKSAYRVNVVSSTEINLLAPNYSADVAKLRAAGVDCFLYAGTVSSGAVRLTEAVHEALPAAKIFGTDGVCTASWTNVDEGGVAPSIDPLIECTAASPDLAATAQGRKFLAAYKARYGTSNPDPYAVVGYEAMRLALDAIAALGSHGDSKSAVIKSLFATADRRSLLGIYGFNAQGVTTLRSYGLYKVGADGNPVFYKLLTPPTH